MPFPLRIFRYIGFIDIASCLLLIFLTFTKSEPKDLIGILQTLISYGLIAASVLVLQALCFFIKLYFVWDLIEQFGSEQSQQRVRASFLLFVGALFLTTFNGFLVTVDSNTLHIICELVFLITITSSHIVLITAIVLEKKQHITNQDRFLICLHYSLTTLLFVVAANYISGLVPFAFTTTLLLAGVTLIVWRGVFVRLVGCIYS